ncbi:uncharacterized protein LOC131676645 [Topomyia yanbarensis]|uniref:uncharacterized protein LOC131676645 n=1 Tax=Topomyia yanbarensis TaxID=2498891 RepID=UPI00273AA1FD|nr:uncharacterized protein LOC131676645 [Topomyia yanbarensis]
MPRNDSKTIDESRIQPGRLMILLREPTTLDEVILQIAKKYGNIKTLHRPGSNPQLVFVQYQDADCAMEAMEELRNYPVFRNVDLAVKSEKYQKDHDNNGGDYSKNHSGGKNKGNQRQNQRGHGNNFNNANGNNDQSMENDMSQNLNLFQPTIYLGCWFCTKMPCFECQCGAYYCDTNCQRSDWAKHKNICMPRLVPISYSNKRMLQEAAASMQNSSISGSNFSSSSQDMNHQQQQQQPQKKGGKDYNSENQQNQRRNAHNVPKNLIPDQVSKSIQKKEQPQNGLDSNKKQGSPKNATDSNKISPLENKLQRLKLARSTVKENVLQPGPFPRTGSRVKISASLESGVVYIYHDNSQPGDTSDYFQLANRVFKASQDAQPVHDIPKADDVIFAPFMGGYYRGKVLRVKGDQLEIQYPDFGNLATISWKQARQITDEDLKWAKYLTLPAMLEGVGTLTREQKKLLEEYEESVEFELVKVRDMQDSDMKEVVLKQPKETNTLNMRLIELKEKESRERKQREEKKKQERAEQERREKEDKQKKDLAAKIADPSNYQPVLFDESIETKQLQMDAKQKLLIIDASELLDTRIISVIAFGCIEQYGEVIQDCGLLGPLDPNPYKPTQEGEVCLVLHENDWTRALYDISEGNFMLLDVGILASVPMANVRRFPPGLSKVVYNNEVIVENLPVLNAMMIDGKPDSIHGKSIEAWVAASDEGVCVRIVP